jgi:hypothetical protein
MGTLMEVSKMYENMMAIDVNRLRNDMKNECLGAYFGGGFGGALVESFDVDKATQEELVEMAQRKGINLRKYQK